MKKIFVIFAAMMLAVTFMPVAASANFASVELHDNGNSPKIDKIETFITPGTFALFANPGITGTVFGDGVSWTIQTVNSKYVLLTGPPASNVGDWKYRFQGDKGPVSMDYFSYSNNDLVWGGTIDGNINILQSGLNPADPKYDRTASPVPLPAAVWFFGTGLVGIFGIRRRFAS